MRNRRPVYKVRRVFFGFEEKKSKKKKRNNFADNYRFFVWSGESSKYSGFGLMISFYVLEDEQEHKGEDKLITF